MKDDKMMPASYYGQCHLESEKPSKPLTYIILDDHINRMVDKAISRFHAELDKKLKNIFAEKQTLLDEFKSIVKIYKPKEAPKNSKNPIKKKED